jgi:hypothetical protein
MVLVWSTIELFPKEREAQAWILISADSRASPAIQHHRGDKKIIGKIISKADHPYRGRRQGQGRMIGIPLNGYRLLKRPGAVPSISKLNGTIAPRPYKAQY